MNLGRKAEDLVAKDYQNRGFKLLQRNYVFRKGKQAGEIDLIFEKDKSIVFVEVKARTTNQFGSAFEAVDYYKQRKLINTAKLYLQFNSKFKDHGYQIDVAAVDIDNKEKPVIILSNAIEDLD